ncbi:MAG: helix-hairpin-helix domain-containing protein [Candidatus Pacearchaeota archaeon]
MKCVLILFVILISINLIYASCSEGQIDINTATKEELEELYGIGPVKADAIINSRQFNSTDDLINVKGIGEIILNKIKEQNLACVENENIEENEEKIQNNSEGNEKDNLVVNKENSPQEINLELKPIKLNSNTKNIKSEDVEKLNTKSYAIYGLVGFGILLAFLFAFKKIKNKKYKNEFN